jgi:hypothetical protein
LGDLALKWHIPFEMCRYIQHPCEHEIVCSLVDVLLEDTLSASLYEVMHIKKYQQEFPQVFRFGEVERPVYKNAVESLREQIRKEWL